MKHDETDEPTIAERFKDWLDSHDFGYEISIWWERDVSIGFKAVSVTVIISALVLAVTLYLGNYFASEQLKYNKHKCETIGASMGYSYRYDESIWTCLIEVEEGKWIPLDSYYYREDGKK